MSDARTPAAGRFRETARRAGDRLVLVVDDYKDTRELYAEYIRMSGIEVETAADGFEGIEKAILLQPDAIVMVSAYTSCAEFIRQMKKAGSGATFYNVSCPATTLCVTEAGRKLMQKFRFVMDSTNVRSC